MPGLPYIFVIMDSLLAEAGQAPQDALHKDARVIARCYQAVQPLVERLGVPPPAPKLAGFGYSHVSTLGAQVVFAEGSEPNVLPPLHAPEDIDLLREPDDYLSAGVVSQRLRVLEDLRAIYPNAVPTIGHLFEGPVTTAALLLGEQFFLLPYDDPERAHRLLSFVTDSAIRYAHILLARLGLPLPEAVGICDDFAGMFQPALFEEFVLPYWDRLYRGMHAGERYLHSELLHVEHLPYLSQVQLKEYDPCSDQYLTPALLREHCPVPFTLGLQSWHIRDNTAEELQQIYRQWATFNPAGIDFTMQFLCEEEKIAALLGTAKELAGVIG